MAKKDRSTQGKKICRHPHTCVHTYIRTFVYTGTSASIHTYVHTHTNPYAYKQANIHPCTDTFHTHIHTCIYGMESLILDESELCIGTRTLRTYMYTFYHTHTHTHTHTRIHTCVHTHENSCINKYIHAYIRKDIYWRRWCWFGRS
jgi:hypothetical protein